MKDNSGNNTTFSDIGWTATKLNFFISFSDAVKHAKIQFMFGVNV